MKIRWYVRAWTKAFALSLAQQLRSVFILFIVIFQPLAYSVLILLLMRNRDPVTAGAYAAVSGTLMSLWMATLYRSIVAVDTERRSGTLEILVAAPLPLTVSLGGTVMASMALTICSLVIAFGAISVLTGSLVVIANPLGFFVSLLLGVAGFSIVGLVVAFWTVLAPEVRSLANGLEIPGYLLGGFIVPAEVLPFPLIYVSYLFPPYWVSKALRETALTATSAAYVNWIPLAVLSCAYLIGSVILLRAVLTRARTEGWLSAF